MTDEVTASKLRDYPLRQLKGRLAYYMREVDRETSSKLRAEFKAEVERTRAELIRRRAQEKFARVLENTVHGSPPLSSIDAQWSEAA